MQKRERKFSMSELWEAAFHLLARLEPRKAYIMVKGAMEHPELIRTITTPQSKSNRFPYNASYRRLEALQAMMTEQRAGLEQKILGYVKKRNS